MSIEEPPTTVEAYIEWAKPNLNADFGAIVERVYKQNTTLAIVAAQEHEFFSDLEEFLHEEQCRYHAEKDSDLLMGRTDNKLVKLVKKPYTSAVNKSFRHNIVYNTQWPDEPEGGWLTPENWFAKRLRQ